MQFSGGFLAEAGSHGGLCGGSFQCCAMATLQWAIPDVKVELSLEAEMDKGDHAVRALATDRVLQKPLAKYLVHRCFRNSVLEGLHAGTAPDSKSGDYSDVVVSTPLGEIPWRKLSRFDDAEMKKLMIDVVQKSYEFIRELFDEEKCGELLLRLTAGDPLPRWEDPK